MCGDKTAQKGSGPARIAAENRTWTSAKARSGTGRLWQSRPWWRHGSKGFLVCTYDVRLFQEYVAIFREKGTVESLSRLGAVVEYWQSNLLHLPVRHAAGVGPAREKFLHDLGIITIGDLLTCYPRRYEDRSSMKPIRDLIAGETVTVRGIVEQVTEQRLKRGRLRLLKATVSDGQDRFHAVWFNQGYMKRQIHAGQEVFLSGKVERKFGEIQMQSPAMEAVEANDPFLTGRIVPIYRGTERLNGSIMRRLIRDNLERWQEHWPGWVPDNLMEKYRLIPPAKALQEIHFPKDEASLKQARRYLVYEEFLMLQIMVQDKRLRFKREFAGIAHTKDPVQVQSFLALLPFTLTKAQQRVLAEILMDMESPEPMNRLLQGDVGSGKTLVAAAALVKTVGSGHQGALMVPTEILAEQHYLKLHPYFHKLGIRCKLLTGKMKAKEKGALYEALQKGEIQVVIGTHALLQDPVAFHSLGLAVTDEQHRFGVSQREVLQNKGKSPDVLVMSATPIPRTLTLTLFGDLDVSVIDELPPGRQKIETYWVQSQLRPRVYRFIREQIRSGRQVYVVCPLVEESEKLQTEAAVEMASRLQNDEFPELAVGLLHGRMKSIEKESVMEQFRCGALHILVATTVIEVGVDVANATVMVIEGADRFGLAQLHQLRGRVGRGEHASYCILVAEPNNPEGEARLNALCRSTDGFQIAEEDLRLRGPGEYVGTRQHGLTNLKIADLVQDTAVMEVARKDALTILNRDEPGSRMLPAIVHVELAYRFGNRSEDTSLT
jgi:ATP-dependent DNA helicase RecG